MPVEEFKERLIDTVVRTRLGMDAGYAFPEGLDEAQGRLYHATFLTHFSFFAWKFPSWLMEVASRCPYQDVRRTVIEDCVDEEVADPDADGRCHIDVLYEEAEACGVSREQIAATRATPIVLACVHALENLSRTLSWQGGFAAVSALEIGSTEEAVALRKRLLTEVQLASGMSGRDSTSLSERTGVPADKLVFAAIHAYKDQFHGGGELKLLIKYGTTREFQDEMLWATRASIEIFCVMREEIDRLARAAVSLAPRERPVIVEATS
jgi:pyrroloquinoline quinone (PQQ) biosynthesis protein C